MIEFWVREYFTQPEFHRIDGKPVVFVFSPGQLKKCAELFGEKAGTLLTRPDAKGKAHGVKGIFFVAVSNEEPGENLQRFFAGEGYSGYTGWNYVLLKDKSKTADYNPMVDTYSNLFAASSQIDKYLPYIASVSPGWDSRPWGSGNAVVRENSTPEKFENMLRPARKFMDTRLGIKRKIVMIEAWNEFGEGAYIEPIQKWGVKYLEAIMNVFGKERSH